MTWVWLAADDQIEGLCPSSTPGGNSVSSTFDQFVETKNQSRFLENV
jgi:hypothetical protein